MSVNMASSVVATITKGVTFSLGITMTPYPWRTFVAVLRPYEPRTTYARCRDLAHMCGIGSLRGRVLLTRKRPQTCFWTQWSRKTLRRALHRRCGNYHVNISASAFEFNCLISIETSITTFTVWVLFWYIHILKWSLFSSLEQVSLIVA